MAETVKQKQNREKVFGNRHTNCLFSKTDKQTMFRRRNKQNGFSLIELLVVILLVAMLAGFVVSYVYSGKNETAAAERLLSDMTSRISERRNSALRLNSIEKPTSLETRTAPPVVIDFGDPETTKSLVTDGIDRDNNHVDDYTGKALTYLEDDGNGGARWVNAYEGDALAFPDGWTVAHSFRTLNLPAISEGAVLTTSIAFNAKGEAVALDSRTGGWNTQPNPDAPNSCWVIYATYPNNQGGIRQREAPTAAVAIAVYPSGLIESWRFADGSWQGFKGRSADAVKKRGGK